MKIFTAHIFLIFFLSSVFAIKAEVAVFDSTAEVGKPCTIRMNVNSDKDNELFIRCSGSFKLFNPTVFYPNEFAGNQIERSNIIRMNDSIYNFSVTFTDSANFQEFYLNGIALAGNDSSALIEFSDINTDNYKHKNSTATIYLLNTGAKLPYIRFPGLQFINPNICQTGATCKIYYLVDKQTDLTFYICDTRGKELQICKVTGAYKGSGYIDYLVANELSAGLYFIKLVTAFGWDYKPFSVIK